MSPKPFTTSIARLRQLIEEGPIIAKLEKPSSVGPYIQDQDTIPLHAWLVRVTNIIESAFGPDSPHFRHLQELMPDGPRHIEHSYEIYNIIGLLKGAIDDLEGGYLQQQSLLVAGEVFDDILEQASHLLENGYKDVSAVLGRVVLEDALKKIASASEIDPSFKPSRINDELKSAGRYPQPQWRLIQAWLDIGNSAAHGEFDKYTIQDVLSMLEGINRFLAAELRQP
jgi:hypothetical protein